MLVAEAVGKVHIVGSKMDRMQAMCASSRINMDNIEPVRSKTYHHQGHGLRKWHCLPGKETKSKSAVRAACGSCSSE